MKRSAFLIAAAFFVCAVQADDRIRDVQAELKSQGFYYGEADGKASDEMSAALRRFQIRNGLTVTGKADDETIEALGLGEAKPKAPAEAPAPPPMKKAPQVNPEPLEENAPRPQTKPRDLLLREREPDAERIERGVRPDPAVVEPPRSIPNATYDPNSSMFRGTPYAVAPRELQEDTIAAAQRILKMERIYRGEVDGSAGPMTSEALFGFQQKYSLRETGRLDLDTLAKMKLLPRVAPPQGARPFYNPNQRRDRSVQRDVWVR